jgi:hypothetical protein
VPGKWDRKAGGLSSNWKRSASDAGSEYIRSIVPNGFISYSSSIQRVACFSYLLWAM